MAAYIVTAGPEEAKRNYPGLAWLTHMKDAHAPIGGDVAMPDHTFSFLAYKQSLHAWYDGPIDQYRIKRALFPAFFFQSKLGVWSLLKKCRGQGLGSLGASAGPVINY